MNNAKILVAEDDQFITRAYSDGLKRAGFEIEHIYGDFFRQELGDDSSEMIWIARKAR